MGHAADHQCHPSLTSAQVHLRHSLQMSLHSCALRPPSLPLSTSGKNINNLLKDEIKTVVKSHVTMWHLFLRGKGGDKNNPRGARGKLLVGNIEGSLKVLP